MMKSAFFTTCACLSLASLLTFGQARAAQVDAFWNPGTASWNLATNWTPAVVPNNGNGGNTYRVFIDNGNATASVATLDTNPTIDQLTISAGDQLSSSNGTDLRIMVGPIVNDGLISWVSSGSATEFELATSMSLTGSGVLFFGNSNENFIDNIDTAVIPHLTHGASHTIRGGGSIVDVTMTNDGLIDANQPTQMSIDLESGTNTNNGTLQASGTGTLLLTGTVWTNTTGMIQALDTSTVNIVSSTILGGTFHAAPGAVISPTSNSLLKDFTLTGLLRQDNTEDAIYEGVITNNGTIAAISTGSATEIQLNVNGATFNGTGEVVLGNHSQNFFDDDDGTGTPMLVNGATHTIRGAGAFFDIGLTNNGLIHADQTTQMTIDLEGTASTQHRHDSGLRHQHAPHHGYNNHEHKWTHSSHRHLDCKHRQLIHSRWHSARRGRRRHQSDQQYPDPRHHSDRPDAPGQQRGCVIRRRHHQQRNHCRPIDRRLYPNPNPPKRRYLQRHRRNTAGQQHSKTSLMTMMAQVTRC